MPYLRDPHSAPIDVRSLDQTLCHPALPKTRIPTTAEGISPEESTFQLIATGTFANIYRISKTRVLKVPIPTQYQSYCAADIEAQIYASLPATSPHTLTYYSATDAGILELEYAPNGTVRDYVRHICNETHTCSKSNMSISIATNNKTTYTSPRPQTHDNPLLSHLAIQTIRALSHLHSHNIIHCDLAARQLLLDSSLTVKIIDFGGSSLNGQPGMGIENATHYMPRGRSSDSNASGNSVKTDLFALGSTLYEIFHRGMAPYWQLGSREVAELFERRVWPGLEGVGEGWAEVIRGCWEGKFESCEEILEVVDGWRKEEGGFVGLGWDG
ncbi:TKL protein kinase [Helicocarpus griseus UAMH5409]|uniref:TKL protein kinase n=1 Tax=Helicocarpus griseus UAMH5409 TaxID=1447875 RepID=A0A2B7XUH8_9EURO|nr:TKL protein kinase [Helicocarpus griseus UAMH5409]